MKLKNLLTATAIVTSTLFTPATSMAEENWVFLSESTESGDRLVVDSESFSFTKDEKDANSPVYIAARFKMGDLNGGRPFALVTPAKSCSNMQGDLWFRVFKNNEWVTKETYFWAKNGKKIYDNGGEALCAIMDVRIQEYEQKKKDSKSKISL